MCLTETWLLEHIPDSNASLLSFQMTQADRDIRSNDKTKSREMAVLEYNRNPGQVTVKERIFH